MSDPSATLGPLLQARQVREFTDAPVDAAQLDALADVARWSGSSQNSQPWRFIVIREPATLRAIADAGLPQTRSLLTARACIAIATAEEKGRGISRAYDEGRAAERILVGASMLGLGAGIAWVTGEARPAVAELLGLPEPWFVRTIVALGHPTERARRPKAGRSEARLPRDETVFDERWRA
jgi:nitroreductase